MKKQIISAIIGFFIVGSCQRPPATYKPVGEPFTPDYALNRFEESIKKYEQEDKEKGTPQGEILFYGSSSWLFWKNIKTDLAPLPIINRGFGGSTIPELIHYTERMVFPYQPKVIVVYGGENDLNGSKPKSPEQVLDSYHAFTSLVLKRLPKAKIVFVSLKLAPSRRKNWELAKQANALIKAYSKGKNLSYIDINPLLFNANGTPKSELYTKDSLHINAQGYQNYGKLLKPFLQSKL